MQILRRKKLFWWGAYLWNAEVPRPGRFPGQGGSQARGRMGALAASLQPEPQQHGI